jgi:hypothetical protein
MREVCHAFGLDTDIKTPLPPTQALHYLANSMVHEAEPLLRRLLALQERALTTEIGCRSEPLIEIHDLLAYTLMLKVNNEACSKPWVALSHGRSGEMTSIQCAFVPSTWLSGS